MHLEWFSCLTIILHQLSRITYAEMYTDLQGYENLIPLSSYQLYQACLEENLPNCDVLNYYEDIEKRGPKFSSWGGKRAKFSSWGGKRGAPFSSWGGKRDPKYITEYLDDEYSDVMDKRTSKFSSWGGKRAAKFSSWGGKRANGYYEDKRRKPAFSSWGGKRSENLDFLSDKQDEHSIRKRETSEEIDVQMPDLWKEFFDRISNPNFNKNHPYEHSVPDTTMRSPVKKSPMPDSNIQNLFKQFVHWTGNQPEEKKNFVMNSQLFKDLNSGNQLRRGRGTVDFYSWGGKRSQSLK